MERKNGLSHCCLFFCQWNLLFILQAYCNYWSLQVNLFGCIKGNLWSSQIVQSVLWCLRNCTTSSCINMNHVFFWIYSRKYGQYTMNQEFTNVPEKPPFDRSSSQDSLDELSLETYWTEIENIKKSSENRQDQEVVVVKEPDGNN